MRRRDQQGGFTVAELLISLSLFGIIGAGISSFAIDTLRRTGLESRISIAAQGLRGATQLLASELRMSSMISPYLPGTDASLSNCGLNLSVTTNSIRFLVVHDDTSAVNGLRAYYVGYIYDSVTKQLRRGEIQSSSNTSCSVPAGDPTASSVAQTLAEDVIAIDANGNGVDDPIFTLSGDIVTINLGAEAKGAGSTRLTQDLSTQVLLRSE